MQDEKSQREIRKIAYALWLKDGQPEGRDREHWEAAKEIWAFRSHNHVLTDDEGESPRQQRADKSASAGRSAGGGTRRQMA
ncbi:hypothetical protein ARD30_03280 [Bosea thiooxidans]|uniref:DUF2934 domain-containing protein n=1 Tax=Bosea thiooxidans TaxID=53254 RepID=A0A0Q3PNN4_9HYPH|nr:DUF2934 domain-containing protein [Bosea thiooxidans]KQK31438.1 hypothetical protein ARD30_03280 [Bosea thiooxidans]SKB79901.1 Protein of unknown function [Bosea thiooxidans]